MVWADKNKVGLINQAPAKYMVGLMNQAPTE